MLVFFSSRNTAASILVFSTRYCQRSVFSSTCSTGRLTSFSLFLTMSATMASSRAIIRQSRMILRRQQFRQASSTTEKAAEVATNAKEGAQQQVSKASEGLSRVTSSASSAVSSAATSASTALGRIGGRTGRYIKFVECGEIHILKLIRAHG